MIEARQSELDRLATLLGHEHDLTVFCETLFAEASRDDVVENVEALLELAQRRRIELQYQARPLGERVFAEKPKQFARRWQRYWETWHAEVGDPHVRGSNATKAVLVHA
jgi:hypothetical protein